MQAPVAVRSPSRFRFFHSRCCLRSRITTACLTLALTWAGVANAQTQVDLDTLDADMASPRAKVLVLGSVHLSNMPDSFKAESLQPVIDRLLAFKPDVITIEAIPGEQCDLARRHPVIYGDDAMSNYCSDPAGARVATGLDVPAAIGQAHKLLANWPAQASPAHRRHLAAVFLAANEDASALVQWLQLEPGERRIGDSLDASLVAQLDRMLVRKDEGYLIAARIAAQLGLQRVHAIDDHTGDNANIPEADAADFGKAIQSAWASAGAQAKPMRDQQDALTQGNDMLALYRYINRPDTLRVVVDSDFSASMRRASPRHYPQIYVGAWETRNLRMVANIRAAFREHPGARVLAIVGSSHKPWFDSLLGQMQGVDIVDVEQALE